MQVENPFQINEMTEKNFVDMFTSKFLFCSEFPQVYVEFNTWSTNYL